LLPWWARRSAYKRLYRQHLAALSARPLIGIVSIRNVQTGKIKDSGTSGKEVIVFCYLLPGFISVPCVHSVCIAMVNRDLHLRERYAGYGMVDIVICLI
jgi:hypothetical protein